MKSLQFAAGTRCVPAWALFGLSGSVRPVAQTGAEARFALKSTRTRGGICDKVTVRLEVG